MKAWRDVGLLFLALAFAAMAGAAEWAVIHAIGGTR